MKSVIDLHWAGKMAFETEVAGHKIRVDAGSDNGGEDSGVRPKPLMLVALAGCTGMDVVSLLAKMRVEIEDLNIMVEGDLEEEHPKYYNKMKVIYHFKGKDLPMDKLEKVVAMSSEKYCGVMALYKKAIPVEIEIRVN